MGERAEYKNLSKGELQYARGYAHCYNIWLDAYNELKDSVSAIKYEDGGGSGGSLPTERLAIKRAKLRGKMKVVEQSAMEADPSLYPWLLKAVTQWDEDYRSLSFGNDPIPCSKRTFHRRKQKVYQLIAEKIL